MSDPNQTDEWVTIARLTRPRGNRGELTAIPLSDHPERFENLEEVTLFGADGFRNAPTKFQIEEIWQHGLRLIFKFAGIDSISEAETLRNAEVRVPFAERFPLPPGEYYHSDLVGCEVIDAANGASLGRVAEFLEQGGSGLLRMDTGEAGRELLIPFHKAVCREVDVAGKRIVADLPEGLLELNN